MLTFTIPAEFAARIATGSAVQIGALIKDAASGQILAHVQETGLLQNVLSGLSPTSFTPLGIVSTVGNTGMNIKNTMEISKIKHMVEHLTNLGMANIALNVVGIGVTAASTAILLKRMGMLQSQVENLDRKVEQNFDEIRHRQYDQILSDLRAATEYSQILSQQRQQDRISWNELAHSLIKIRSNILTMLEKFFTTSKAASLDVYQHLLRGYLISNAAIVQCFMRCNEMQVALGEARNISENFNTYFGRLNPQEAIRLMLARKSSVYIREHLDDLTRQTHGMLSGLRQHTQLAEHRALLLQSLKDKNIDGHEYLSRIEQEKNEPVLLLPV
jgi:hypothetical protein